MADFGKILEEWDRRSPRDFRRPGRSESGEAGEREEDSAPSRITRAEIEGLPVDAVLDLHGLSSAAAEEALSAFFRDAACRGLAKVLVIHGKGHHSEGEPVLKRTVRDFLESSPLAGRHGPAERRQGGSGAVWVLIKSGAQRSR